jgi:MYXO-CTERM domain-containing protein
MKLIITLFTALLLTQQVNAELVASDWALENDRKVLLDTDTGIEWLKLSTTVGQTDAQITAGMASGGIYEGFRAATASEVQTLALTFDPNVTTNSWYSGTRSADRAGFDAGQSWITLMGQTSFDNTYIVSFYEYLTASIGRIHNTTNSHTGSIRRTTSVSTSKSMTSHLAYYSNPAKRDVSGVFLVSDGGATYSSQLDPSLNINNPNAPVSNVSGPAFLGLFGFGALALGVRRRTLNIK